MKQQKITRKRLLGTVGALTLALTPLASNLYESQNNLNNKYSLESRLDYSKLESSENYGLEHAVNDKLFECNSNIPDKEIEYIKISERIKKSGPVETVKVALYVDKDDWEELPAGLTKNEFYNGASRNGVKYKGIKDIYFKNTLITLLKGVPLLHPGPINSDDILDQFIKSADNHIMNTSGDNFYELDPDVEFTSRDRETLIKIFDEGLWSPISGPISKLNNKEVYKFPPKSEIELVKNTSSYIKIRVNKNMDYNGLPEYSEPHIINLDDSERKHIFNLMLRLGLLSEDPDTKNLIPINNLYEKYQNR